MGVAVGVFQGDMEGVGVVGVFPFDLFRAAKSEGGSA